jgi:large subunit ribosomal protein L25
MEKTILMASERAKKTGKFREKGYVAGVLYGDSIAVAHTVKFETTAINKVIASHGSNAKVWIKYKDDSKLGFIKEVQRDAISQLVTHLDVQIVSKDHEIKLEIPINFKGEDDLAIRKLQLQVYKSSVTVSGMMDLLPDAIYVEVADMTLGDAITLDRLDLDQRLKVNDKEDTVYGMIINQPVEAAVTPATV